MFGTARPGERRPETRWKQGDILEIGAEPLTSPAWNIGCTPAADDESYPH
jgi:hypothetical protein